MYSSSRFVTLSRHKSKPVCSPGGCVPLLVTCYLQPLSARRITAAGTAPTAASRRGDWLQPRTGQQGWRAMPRTHVAYLQATPATEQERSTGAHCSVSTDPQGPFTSEQSLSFVSVQRRARDRLERGFVSGEHGSSPGDQTIQQPEEG